jgi:hypothetical protein
LKAFEPGWAHTDSNRGPSACKADALNQLSYAPLNRFSLKAGANVGTFYFVEQHHLIFFLKYFKKYAGGWFRVVSGEVLPNCLALALALRLFAQSRVGQQGVGQFRL